MIGEPDHLDAAIDAALGTAQAPPADDLDMAIDAALADEGGGLMDYAKAAARGLGEAALGTVEGIADIGEAWGRRALGPQPPIAEAVSAARADLPQPHPEVANSFLGQTAEMAGGVGGYVLGGALIPGGPIVRGLGMAGAMGAGSFGQAKDRALAEGASLEEAELAGAANIPGGAMQAIPLAGPAGKVFGRAANLVAKNVPLSAGAKAVEFAGMNAAARGWAEGVAQSIHGEGDYEAVVDAALNTSLPEWVVGAFLGGAATWRANRRGQQLSEDSLRAVQEAGEALARERAADMADEAPDAVDAQEAPGEPVVAPDAAVEPARDPGGRIEVPDEALAAAAGRFGKGLKRKEPIELYETDPDTAERAGRLGLRVADFDLGDDSPAEGYFDKESRTVLLNRRASTAERKRDLLRHELSHFADEAHPELAAEWAEALTDVAPGWVKTTAAARRQRHKDEGLPPLTKEGAKGEARAEAAEGLGTVLDLIEREPALVEKVASYKPGLIRSLLDALTDFANRIGLTKRTSFAKKIAELDAYLAEKGGDLEKRVGAQKAAQLGMKLRDIYREMLVDEPAAQPRANAKPKPPPMPEPAQEALAPEKAITREFLKRKDLTPEDAAIALETIDTRIEDMLVAGESQTSPRFVETVRDRQLAVKKLYEREPTHRLLSRESPVDVWRGIEAEARRETEQRSAARMQAAARNERARAALDAELAEATAKIARQKMREAAKYEADFQKMVKEVEAEERAAKKAEQERETQRLAEERKADERARAEELKNLKRDIRARFKAEKAARGAEGKTQKSDAGSSAPELPLQPRGEETHTPEKVDLPTFDDRLRDPHMRRLIESMAEKEAKWLMVGGEKSTMPGRDRDPNKQYPRDSWVAEHEWWQKKAQAGFGYDQAETQAIVKKALAGKKLTEKQQSYVVYMLDHAWKRLYRGVETDEDYARARAYWDAEAARMEDARIDETEIREDEELPPTGTQEDVPFALPIRPRKGQGAFDFGEPAPAQHGATLEDLVRQAKAGDRPALGVILERHRAYLATVIEKALGENLRARTTVDDVLQDAYAQVVRDIGKFEYQSDSALKGWLAQVARNAVGDVAEKFAAAKRTAGETAIDAGAEDAEGVRASLRDEGAGPETASVTEEANARVRAAVRRLKGDARSVIEMRYFEGLSLAEIGERLGVSEDAARMKTNRAEASLGKILAQFNRGNLLYALKNGGRDGAGLDDLIERLTGTRPHYAVTSKGPVTQAARAAAETFWQYEKRTILEAQRQARALLGTKAGKAEVDAVLRGEKLIDLKEQSVYTVAAEMRVNSMLLAAKRGTTSTQKAVDLTVNYYMARSEQGYTLSAVRRPRDPQSLLLAEMAEPSPRSRKELAQLAKERRAATDEATLKRIAERVQEIKAREAKNVEQGLLALKKKKIDLENISTTVDAARAYKVFAQAAMDKADQYARWVIEWRASAMVSHPSTVISSLVGNVANVGWNTVLKRIAELPLSAVSQHGATVGELRAMAAALPTAFNKAMNAFLAVQKYDTPIYESGLQEAGLIDDAQAFENAKLSSIPGLAGRIVRAPGLTQMTAMDEFARALGTELEAVGIAYRRAKGDQARMAELLTDERVWAEAVKRTRRTIFQEESDALVDLGFKAREILDKATGETVPLGTLMFPFVRTGANGLLEALRKMPGPAQVIAFKNMADGSYKTDKELLASDFAANLLSIGVGATLWGLANAQDEEGRPYITGTAHGTRGEKSLAWRTAPPMSVRSGDQWRSYSKLMPFAGLTATTLDAAQSGVDPVAIVRSLGRQAIDSTYLRTVGTIMDTLQSEAPTDLKMAQATRDFAASFAPNILRGAAVAGQDTMQADPLRRQGEGSMEATDALRALPFRLGLEETEDRFDWLGRPVEKGGSFLERYLSPMAPMRKSEMHPADQMLVAYRESLPEAERDKAWLPVEAPYWYRVRGETRYMSQRQYAEFSKRAGDYVRSWLDDATLNTKNPTKQDVERLRKLLARARSLARRQVLQEIPDEEDEG